MNKLVLAAQQVQSVLDGAGIAFCFIGEFALRYRVLLLKTADEIGIDATLSALPFEAEIIARSTSFEFAPGVILRTCSAEDLLVMKIFAGRPIDWRDVEMILRRYGRGGLDLTAVEARVMPLLEAKDERSSWNEYLRLLETLPMSR